MLSLEKEYVLSSFSLPHILLLAENAIIKNKKVLTPPSLETREIYVLGCSWAAIF